MSRSRVRHRSDGIPEIIGHPRPRQGGRTLALALASALVSGAAVSLIALGPEGVGGVWVALASAAMLASALLLWRPLLGPRSRSPGAKPARVHPIRPAPSASTRGA
jgi:hypothetical protein